MFLTWWVTKYIYLTSVQVQTVNATTENRRCSTHSRGWRASVEPCRRLSASSSSSGFHLQTVGRWQQRRLVQVFMRPSWQQTCRRLPRRCRHVGPRDRCDEHVKPCGAAGETSVNPQVSGPFQPSCTSFCSMFLIRRLERKTSGSVNPSWKLCSLTQLLKVCFEGPIAPFILQDTDRGCIGDFNMTCFDFPQGQSVCSCSLVLISDQEDCGFSLSVHQLLPQINSQERIWCVLGGWSKQSWIKKLISAPSRFPQIKITSTSTNHQKQNKTLFMANISWRLALVSSCLGLGPDPVLFSFGLGPDPVLFSFGLGPDSVLSRLKNISLSIWHFLFFLLLFTSPHFGNNCSPTGHHIAGKCEQNSAQFELLV